MCCTGMRLSVRHTISMLVLSTSVTTSVQEVQAQLVVHVSQDALLYKDDVSATLLDLLAYVEDALPLNCLACVFLNCITILMGF
jgi:hypothetical protein